MVDLHHQAIAAPVQHRDHLAVAAGQYGQLAVLPYPIVQAQVHAALELAEVAQDLPIRRGLEGQLGIRAFGARILVWFRLWVRLLGAYAHQPVLGLDGLLLCIG